MAREIALFSDLISLCKFLLYFCGNRPDILHANTPKGSFLSLTAGWFCGVKTRIYYVHGLRYQGASGLKKKLLMNMEKISCFFETDIMAVSNGVREVLQSDKITNKNINIIWNGSVNGIDLEYFDPQHADVGDIRAEHGIAEDDFVFGFLGRLVGDKGINELVASFNEMSLNFSKVKLILVGDFEKKLDPLKNDTLRILRENPNIILTGAQKDVRPFLSAMDIFVFPSYREGFGIVLMEAAAMNVPAISSDIIGCNEIIQNGQNGFLVPPKDKDILLEKMKFCLNNRFLIKQMSQGTRPLIASRYEQKELWCKTVAFYKKISD
jgi:glycosyltransferase involved in cell wall biosynthesis